MTKRNKIIYWVATIWLSLGMTSTGIVQLLGLKEEIQFITDMGYPIYFLHILGLSKLLGVITILIPRFPLLKEWAYAGFVFTMTGAVYSHIAVHHPATDMFGPVLLLVLTIVSRQFRPEDRKLIISK